MKRGSLKIINSLTSISLCILLVFTSLPLKVMKRQNVNADMSMASAVSLLDDYTLIVFGDHSVKNEHIKGPWAVEGDITFNGKVSMSKNNDNSYFLPRTYDFVLGGKAIYETDSYGLGLTNDDEEYLIASVNEANLRVVELANGTTYNEATINTFGTEENPLPFNFDDAKKAFQAWNSDVYDFCTTEDNPKVIDIDISDRTYGDIEINAGSGTTYVNLKLSDESYANYDNIKIRVPSKNDNVVINMESGIFNIGKAMLAIGDGEFVNVGHGENATNINQTSEEDVERTIWFNEHVIYNYAGKDEIKVNLPLGSLIAPNASIVVKGNYFNGSWVVKNIRGEYGEIHAYSVGLAYTGWADSIPSHTPNLSEDITVEDVVVTVKDDKGNPVKGVEVTLTDSNNDEHVLTTGDDGKVTFKDIPQGDYTVEETKVPGNYEDANPSKKTGNVDGDKSTPETESFTNAAVTEDVVVTVKDDKGNPVKGVEVTLTDSNSDEHVLTTGDDGKVTFKDIPQGDYTVEETKVPGNYEDANPSKKTGNVDGDKSTPETEDFTNAAVTEDVVVTVKDDKGNPVKGVEVTLTDSNNDEHVLTTGDDGKVTFKDIPQGDYTVEETKVPGNYEDANPSKKTGNVDGDKSTLETESFTNAAVTEDVVVTVKDDKGNPVKGVEVTLTDSNSDEHVLTTGDDGKVTFKDIPQGDYTVEETNVPGNYEDANPSKKTGNVDGDKTTPETESFTNNKSPDPIVTEDVVVTVKDDKGNPVKGVEVTLTDSNNDEHVLTTGDDGKVTFKDIPQGDYTVEETKVPGNYEDANPSKKTGNVDGDKSTPETEDFINAAVTEDVVVTVKDDKGNPVKGVEVTLTDSNSDEHVLTTGDDGKVTFKDIPQGDYTVEETKVPGNYEDANPSKKTGKVDGDKTTPETESFTNAAVTEDVVVTVKDDKGNPVKGVEVTLTDLNSDEHVLTTGDDGKVTFKDIPQGDYTVEETNVPGNYEDANPSKKTGNVDGDKSTLETESFTNAAVTEDVVVTVKDDKGNPVKGVEVTLTDSNNDEHVLTTGDDGKVTFKDIPQGDYTVEETKVPGNYEDANPSKKTGNVDGDKSTLETESFTNNKTPDPIVTEDVVVTVKDDKGNPVKGVEVTLTDSNNDEHVLTTGDDGKVTFKDIPQGDYTVEETKVPGNYEDANPSKKTGNVDGDKSTPETEDFTNALTKEDVVVTVKDDKGNPVKGVEVTLTDSNSDEHVLTTGDDGKVTFKDIPQGDYTVEETNVPGNYEDANPSKKTGNVDGDKSTPETESFTNAAVTEDVVVTVKDDKGNPVKGVEVTLTDSNNDTHKETTGEDGKVTFKDIPQGDYTVEETKVPGNYEDANPSKKTGKVDGDKSTPETESFTNAAVTEDVVVTVKDDKGNPVKGVEVTLTDSNNDTHKETTGEDGKVTFKDIPQGDYTVEETKVPGNYEDANPSKKTGNVDGDKSTPETESFTNAAVTEDVVVTVKDDKGNPVKGVEVTLTDSNNDTHKETTGEDGKVTFKDIPQGDYTVEETKVPGNYEDANPSKKTGNVDGDKSTLETESFTNAAVTEDIVVTVKDDKGNPISNAEITLIDSNNKVYVETTSTDGKVTFKDIPQGDYEVTETKVPDGYKPDDNTSKTGNVDGDKSTANEEKFTNEFIKEDITIIVTDEDGKAIPGVDIVLTDSNGNVIEKSTTDESGKVSFSDLTKGDYEVTETKVPSGYSNDNNGPHKVVVDETGVKFDGDATPDEDNTLIIMNGAEKYEINLNVRVYDEQDNILSGAEIKIATDVEMKSVLGTGTTNGVNAVAFKSLAAGTYYITETVIPNGYIWDSHIYVLVVKVDGTVTIDGKEIDNDGIFRAGASSTTKTVNLDIVNKLYKVAVPVKVVDDNNNPIPGAQITVYDENNKPIATITSDNNGIVNIPELTEGEYSLVQTAIPEGYTSTSTDLKISIDAETGIIVNGTPITDAGITITDIKTKEPDPTPTVTPAVTPTTTVTPAVTPAVTPTTTATPNPTATPSTNSGVTRTGEVVSINNLIGFALLAIATFILIRMAKRKYQ